MQKEIKQHKNGRVTEIITRNDDGQIIERRVFDKDGKSKVMPLGESGPVCDVGGVGEYVPPSEEERNVWCQLTPESLDEWDSYLKSRLEHNQFGLPVYRHYRYGEPWDANKYETVLKNLDDCAEWYLNRLRHNIENPNLNRAKIAVQQALIVLGDTDKMIDDIKTIIRDTVGTFSTTGPCPQGAQGFRSKTLAIDVDAEMKKYLESIRLAKQSVIDCLAAYNGKDYFEAYGLISKVSGCIYESTGSLNKIMLVLEQ